MDETAAIDTGNGHVHVDEPRRCAGCGLEAPPNAKFCAECGSRLDAVAPTAELRKLVTLLFCDLVGSTALGERLDPEAFRRVQLRYYATCETVLHRHRGTIEKFIGDAVLCVFGIPTAYEDDAHKACRAALDLISGVEALNVELEAEWGVRLSVRIGVNTGVVVVGEVSHGQQVVTGDPVNTAARLEQAAGAGEVLIGATTRELIGEEGICVPVPPLELKGKGGRVPAWRLVDMDVARTVDITRTQTQPLIGREDELERIDSWLTGRAAGMCLILGAPGIGKSRLLVEAIGRTSRSVYWGRCPPYGEEITYRALADWLEALGDDAVEGAVGEQLAERLRFATERSDTPATRQEIEDAARVLMTALGRSGDLLLVAEDVHWAELSMLDLLISLASVPGVAIIATARPEVLDVRADLASGRHDIRLDLGALSRDAAEQLCHAVTVDVERADLERILGDAEGNPLMILQLALHMAEGGDPERLPAGLEAVLQARVERLSAEERAVAERGAVMGREFWDSGVAALAPEAPAPATAIGLLARRNFVVEGRADGAPEVASPTLSRVFSAAAQPYSFTHALLRDRIYESTPKLRRADLHERLGGLLEESGAAGELVAFHLERAARLRSELRPQEAEELAARAAEHLERAGERALARRDADAARAFLTRAAALLDDGSSVRERIETSLAASDLVQVGTELVPGDVIGGYRIRAVAGRGGMGVVYRAEDLALGREVALKVIAPDLAGDSGFRQRFARESRIAAGLEHPNVVPVYTAGEDSGRLFIAMRFVQGTDLQLLIREALSPERAVAIISQVAEALDAAHRRGLVHRDVKPANVLVARVGGAEQAYLTDFGLTREAAAGDGLTKTGQWVGTLAYVAPEQIRGEPVDGRADIYALGAVLFQCLTGRPPFSVESELEALAAHLDEPPPRPSKDGAPRGLDGVVERAMSKDPSRRYRSAGDLGRAAVAAVEGRRARLTERSVATGAAAPIEIGRRRRRQGRRGTAVAGLGAGVAIAGLAAAVAFATGVFSSGGGTANSANAAGRLDGVPIRLDQPPERLAVAGGYLWAMQTASGRLARIDLEAGGIEYSRAPIDLGGGTFPDLTGGLGSLWQTHANPTVGGVDRIDPTTVEAIERIALPSANVLAVGTDAVWATTAPAQGSRKPGALARIDPGRNRLVGSLPLGRDLADVAVAAGAVWVVDRARDSVVRLDQSTMRVRARVLVGNDPALVAVSPRAVWVANLGDRTLTRIDPRRNEAAGAPVSLGKELEDILTANGALWVAAADGTVTRLEAATGKLVGTPIPVGRSPLTLAWDRERLWVASASDQTVQAIIP